MDNVVNVHYMHGKQYSQESFLLHCTNNTNHLLRLPPTMACIITSYRRKVNACPDKPSKVSSIQNVGTHIQRPDVQA